MCNLCWVKVVLKVSLNKWSKTAQDYRQFLFWAPLSTFYRPHGLVLPTKGSTKPPPNFILVSSRSSADRAAHFQPWNSTERSPIFRMAFLLIFLFQNSPLGSQSQSSCGPKLCNLCWLKVVLKVWLNKCCKQHKTNAKFSFGLFWSPFRSKMYLLDPTLLHSS